MPMPTRKHQTHGQHGDHQVVFQQGGYHILVLLGLDESSLPKSKVHLGSCCLQQWCTLEFAVSTHEWSHIKITGYMFRQLLYFSETAASRDNKPFKASDRLSEAKQWREKQSLTTMPTSFRLGGLAPLCSGCCTNRGNTCCIFLNSTCCSADLRRNPLGTLVAAIKAMHKLCSIGQHRTRMWLGSLRTQQRQWNPWISEQSLKLLSSNRGLGICQAIKERVRLSHLWHNSFILNKS